MSPVSKEFRPLWLPMAIAALGSIVPPRDDLLAMLGTLAFFGGFAVLAAMTFGIEFQYRTLPLLLSQPAERSRFWRDKTLVVFLIGAGLLLINWRVQQIISELGPLSLFVFWMFVVATVCARGFWIQTTGSVLGGLACDLINQVLVFGGLFSVLRRDQALSGGNELIWPLFLATVAYVLAFLWLGRRFWKRALLKNGSALLGVLVLSAISQILYTNEVGEGKYAEFCLVITFMIATASSAAFWTLVARTTIGGAALSLAAQFLTGLAAVFGLALLYRAEPDLGQARFLVPVVLIALTYCAALLWLGKRRFARMELREPAASENLAHFSLIFRPGLSTREAWSPAWLRCRTGQSLRNLARKELRLQKPLLMLAGLFLICWLAAFCFHWVLPAYATLSDVVICLYVPVALLLAGCISLGDEKSLGLTAWHLALPVSAQVQWLVKLLVAAATGSVLGLLLPLALHVLAVFATAAPGAREFHSDAAIVIGFISGALFILSFWAGTLLNNTIRAAISAVVALLALFLCGVLGSWCAAHLELWRTALFPVIDWLVVPISQSSGVVNPRTTTFFLGIVIGVGIALLQSCRQFRRAQNSLGTGVRAALVLALVFVMQGFFIRAIDFMGYA